MASRSETRRHSGPYEAAVVPGISTRELTLTGAVAALAGDAAAELSRFDVEMGGEVAPFGAVPLRSESAASSQIENLTASARAIAEAEIGVRSRRNADLIVANTRSMDAAVALAGRLDGYSILAMQRGLMQTSNPDIAGRWRTGQVWIGGGSIGPQGALFVPPHHGRVEAAIDDLVRFMGRDDIPVLAQVAVAHAHLETIHPFPDGNGRTGRALVHAMLRNKALTRNVTVPISAGLLRDALRYFAAVNNGRRLVAELRGLRASWSDLVTARRDSKVWIVADLLLRHPVVNAPLVAAELGIHPPNVHRHIQPLEEVGVLTEFTDQKRNRVWGSQDVLAALDAFATRAGRRTQI